MMAFMLFQDTEPPLTALEENLSSTISAGLGSGAASSKLSAEGAKQSREAASSENTPAASREVAQAQDEGRQLGRSSMTATARNLAETPAQTANAKAQEETEKTGQQVDGVRETEIQAEVVRAELAATQRYIRELEAAIRSAGAHHELVPLR